ncbi:MAG: MogA/MoaB family molybdenum cofactor biosynthesis protein [Methanomicrobiales archaeon]|jgi:molybdenum cofactor biosynthesis protein B|nr:MogA/MoaB family molybdenum cofactor biosynthesis protein [Methanomicrobiales archaeon]
MDPTHIQPISIMAAVLTISTSRNEGNDKSGAIIRDLFARENIPVSAYKVVPDDKRSIQYELLQALAIDGVNCIIINGGTGITHDDCTIEAVEPLLHKRIEGFGELFRALSHADIGTRSLLSRATAGIIDQKAVFCIPGSTGAVSLAMEAIILPEIRHILTHARS